MLRASSLTPVHKYLKELKLVLDTPKISGKDPILIFDFSTRLVEEREKLQMSEGQAYILLIQFLSNPVSFQFRAVKTG